MAFGHGGRINYIVIMLKHIVAERALVNNVDLNALVIIHAACLCRGKRTIMVRRFYDYRKIKILVIASCIYIRSSVVFIHFEL